MSKDRDDYALATDMYDRFMPNNPTNPAALVDVDIAGQMRSARSGVVITGYDHAATGADGSPNLLSNVHINRLHRFVEQMEYMLAGLRRQIFAHKIRVATYPPQIDALNSKLTFIETFYSTQLCDDEADACVFNSGWGLPDDNTLIHDALGMRLWNAATGSVNVSYRTKDLLDDSYSVPTNSHVYEPNKQTGSPLIINDTDNIYMYADGNKEFWENANNKIKLQIDAEELVFDSAASIGDFVRHWQEAPAFSTGGGSSLVATVTLTPQAVLHCFAIYIV